LDVRQDVRDRAVVVSANGVVDSSTVEDFQMDLTGALEAATGHPAKMLVLALGGVTYFGSAGLNAVLACYERGESDGVAVRVVAANAEVLRPIEVTKLDSVLRPFSTVEKAMGDD
jgi:anti-anti-sigma factor